MDINRKWSDLVLYFKHLFTKKKEIKLMKQGYITTWLDYKLTNQNAPTIGIKFK